ncbi:MAG: alpha/beta hydrolase [Candidatus Omnitrophica bacterium]|nr:alpha/beta hydrolase [Candidatus Omnitrophota bacterium]
MIVKFFFYIFVGLGVLFLYIKYIEKKSIFFPDKNIDLTPERFGLSFEDLYFLTSDKVRLNAWFIPHPEAAKTIILFHGNAGNNSNRLEKIALLRKLKINIFMVDYRGYGNSQGIPKEKGIYLDAQAAYGYLVNQRKINPEDIVLYGESLGGVVAVDLASTKKVAGIILEGTFSSGRDIGQIIYPFLPKTILPNIFNSLSKISKVKAEKLFIHSKDDLIVPLELGRKLYQAASGPKKFITVSGTHNSVFIDSEKEYLRALSDFIRGLDE